MLQARSRPNPSRGSWPRARWRVTLVPLLALLPWLWGCGPKVVLDPVSDKPDEFSVFLRRTVEGKRPIPKNFAHPATISDVRLAHILANLAFENSEGKRQPVIQSVRVYPLAEALNQAVTRASEDDEIVSIVYGTSRRLGLFSSRRVTSFRMFFDDQFMNLEFYDIELELEPGEGKPGRDDSYRVPEQTPESAPRFKVLAGQALAAANARTLQVDWRDPYFARPVSLSVRGNRFKRRSVLMEADPEPPVPLPDTSGATSISAEMRDAQIRALDQLDGLRRQGLIKEVEFQRRRRLILQGKLDEAGYEPDAE